MVRVEDVMRDLETTSRFIESQRKAKQDVAGILDAQCRAVERKLNSLMNVDLVTAAALTDTITSGPWTQDQMNTLATIVRSLLDAENATTDGGTITKRRAMQKCTSIGQYLTHGEWDGLRSDAMLCAKVSQLAQRAWSLGITCPLETTTYEFVKLLVHAGHWKTQLPSDEDIKAAFYDIKSAIKDCDSNQRHPLPHLVKYPINPKDLSDDRYNFAYPDEPPMPVSSVSACKKPNLRTHGDKGDKNDDLLDQLKRLLKPDARDKGSRAKKIKKEIKDDTSEDEPKDEIKPEQRVKLEAHRGGSSESSTINMASLQNSYLAFRPQIARPSSVAMSRSLMMPKVETSESAKHADHGIAEDGTDEDSDDDIAKMEKEMCKARAKKAPSKAMKRPAACALPARTVKKRPAAAALPAANLSSVPYKVTWDKDGKKINKNTFASRHYGKCKTKAKAKGFDPDESREFAKAAYSTASALWVSRTS
jgi:hypothetical protein